MEFPNEMLHSSSSPSSSSSPCPPPCLRLRRFDENFTKHFRESEQHECKQRLLKKELQGCSCRSLDHDDEDGDHDVDGSAFVSTSTTTTTTRLNTFWSRHRSNGSTGGGPRRRVINRHYSLQEWMMNSHRCYPTVTSSTSNNNPLEETAAAFLDDDDDTTIIISEPVLVGSKNSVFTLGGGGRRAKKKQQQQPIISQLATGGHHGLAVVESSNNNKDNDDDDNDDDDNSSIDPDMPVLTHMHSSTTSSCSPSMKYNPTPQQPLEQQQQQQQLPAVLQCLFGRRANNKPDDDGGTTTTIYVPPPPNLTMEAAFGPCPCSPSPTDSNITRSDTDDDEDDDEDIRQLAFCPIPLIVVDVDESSLFASPPPPPPMVDRWSPSPTVNMFSSSEEPPKLPTRRGGGRHCHVEQQEQELLPLSPPRLSTRRPKIMEKNEILATTGISPPPPLPCPVPRLDAAAGCCCPLSKPIPRIAATLPRGTCRTLLCDNGGIVVAVAQQVTAPTAPPSPLSNGAKKDQEDTDSVVLPLISSIMTDVVPTPTPHQHGYGYHHHHHHGTIQRKNNNNNVVLSKRRGILKDNGGVTRGHGKSIREGTTACNNGGGGGLNLRGDKNDYPSSFHKHKKERNVTFDRIHIREYERILGDNPSCSCGPPISLGWLYWDWFDSTLDAYECQKKSSPHHQQRGGKRDFYLSPSRRCELILHEWEQVVRRRGAQQCEEEAALVQSCREKSSIVASRRSKSSPPLPSSAVAFLCKPSIDDSDTSQPTSLHGRREGGGSPITITTTTSQKHATLRNDNDDVDESKIRHGSIV